MKRFVSTLLVGVLASVLTACGSSTPTKSAASASPSTLRSPTSLPSVAPTIPPARSANDRSAKRFARAVIETFYYALATRDEAPLAALVDPDVTCQGCADTSAAIAQLAEQQSYQFPGPIALRNLAVTGREDPQVIVIATARVAGGTWFDETDGQTGVLAAQRARFSLLLAWDKATKSWLLQDYTVKS